MCDKFVIRSVSLVFVCKLIAGCFECPLSTDFIESLKCNRLDEYRIEGAELGVINNNDVPCIP